MLKLNRDNKEAPAAATPQGISARGNSLARITATAMAVILLPLLLGFAYLLLLREPGAQDRQMEHIATSYAGQQAANIHHQLDRLRQRVSSAAASPLALSAVAAGDDSDVELVEQAMLDYFPDLISLRLLPIDDMGTATFKGGNRGLRNHIEVDLVRRTSEGDEQPPVSYQFENRWITSLAARVSNPRITEQRAVILVSLDNRQLSERLQPLDSSVGRFALEQLYTGHDGQQQVDVIASAGSGDVQAYTRMADIPATSWRVAFTPSRSLYAELASSPLPLYALLGLSLLAVLAAAVLIVRRFSQSLAAEVERVISVADKKSSLQLAIPELVTIAKQLRRTTMRSLRQTSTPGIPQPLVESEPDRDGSFSDPLFHKDSILDEGGEDVLELDLPEEEQEQASDRAGFPAHVFRAYDIRGDADHELSNNLISAIGGAIGTMAGEIGEQTLVVGCDGRLSSNRIKSCLLRALMEAGRDVIDVGLVPTPLLYYATRHLNCDSGVMITGSHNPADHNGLKIVLKGQTIHAGGIQEIRERAEAGQFSRGAGRTVREDIAPAYIEEVINDIAIAVPLKIVIDAGNGATSEIAPELFQELGCEVIPLYCEIDGKFPNHPPDTSDETNLADLCRAVQDNQADFGVAFDGDGDRLAVVSPTGHIVRTDRLMMLFAQDVVSRNPGADVVFDVKSSRHLSQLISRQGGRPVLWKTGHAYMKQKMAETGALLGGEFSGHIFFGERWYGFDDGMYAAGRLAEILGTLGRSLEDLLAALPQSVSTPEILIPVAEGAKFGIIERIAAGLSFPSGKVNTMDGVRVDFNNGWGLLRASNTSANLTARFEADSQEALDSIMQEFRTQIAQVVPDLDLGF